MRSLHALVVVAAAACSSTSNKTVVTPTLPTSDTDKTPTIPVEAVTEKTVTEDTAMADGDGNTFVAPAEWKVTVKGAMTILTPPEGTSHLAFVDVSADDADAAVAQAWKIYMPDMKWPLLAAMPAADRDGWSKVKNYGYQTSPNEKRAVQAGALFANGRWLVVLVDFDQSVGEKRAGQIGKVFDHLYPKGYSHESFKGKTAAKLDAAKIEQIKKFVADAVTATNVPGVSFGIVQDGKVAFAGGVGVRELGKPDKVDEKTLFMIASNTKSLTTLMLAKLVDQKKLAWDAPVTSVLPAFKLGNDEVTKQVLVKHLVCACTGLPRQDLEFLLEWKGSTPESIMKTLSTMMPTSKFGELFQYSNLMAAAGGYVGGHAAFGKLALGPAYDKAMQTLVFDPLGMTATTFDYAKALKANHAMPHGIDLDGKPGPAVMAENYSVIAARPAGGAWSNVVDVLKYLQMELDKGKVNGKPYIGEEALLARRIPNVAVGSDAAYGMGLFLHNDTDVLVIDHGGDLIGYHSDMMWLPEHGVAAVILTNGDLGPIIRNQFRRKLLEVLFEGKPEADENVATSAKNYLARLEVSRKLLSLPADAEVVKGLAKKYKNASLGEIAVKTDKGKTVVDFGEFSSEVGSLKNPDGTVSITTTAIGLSGLDFVVGTADGKPTLTMRDGQHEYVFTAQ